MKRHLLLLVWWCFSWAASAQDCQNMDLSEGSFNSWQCFTGWCCDINTPNLGQVAGRHTIVSGPGTAPYTCGNVPLVPPGYTFSARIGNDNTGAEAERISYTVNVTEESTLIIYKYAVVLEDPGHSSFEQPRFLARVTDQTGDVIDCTVYQVAASQNLPGFQSCGGVVYQNWTTVGVDVSNYIGQQVTLEFATGDCSLGGHFGHAYVVAECRPLELETRYCVGSDNIATISAPEGFTYVWSTGETTQSIEIFNPQEGQVISCQITSVTGCQAYLSSIMTPSSTIAAFNPTVPCTADGYFDNVSIINNGVLSATQWEVSDGFTSTDMHLSHVFAQPGTYDVTLIVTNDADCSDTLTQQVVIRQSPVAEYVPGEVCAGLPIELVADSYIVDNSPIFNTWVHGDSITVDGNELNLLYPDSGAYSVSLVTVAANGCMDVLDSLVIVHPNPEPSFALGDFCSNDSFQIVNSSTTFSGAPVYSYSNAPSGFQSALAEPLVSGLAHGDQYMTLEIAEPHGPVTCEASTVVPFTVHPVPVAAFSGDTTGCAGEWMIFANSSTIAGNEPLSYRWYLNGALTSASTDYSVPLDSGVYSLKLVVTSLFGCADSVTHEVHMYPYPQVDLSADPDGCPPFAPGETTVVTGHWGNLVSYAWTINGDTVATGASPALILEESGIQTIGVNVTAGDILQQCPGQDQVDVNVFYLPEVSTDVQSACTGQSVLANMTTLGGNATITGYQWISDDGFASNETDFVHAFATPGEHQIILQASTSDGCFGQTSQTVYIHPTPEISFHAGNPCAGEGLDLSATSAVGDGSALTHEWEMGGVSGMGEVWSPVVSDTGWVSVQLTSTSAFNCPDSLTQVVQVHPDPVAVPVLPPVCQFTEVTPQNESITTAQDFSHTWLLDGAFYSDEILPFFSAQDAGDFPFTLVVEEWYGPGSCRDSADVLLEIWPVPVPGVAGDTSICAMSELDLISTTVIANNAPYNSEWSINGELVSTSQELSYLVADSGVYQVNLYQYTPHCDAGMDLSVWVYPVPDVTVFPDTAFCPPGEVPVRIEVNSYWGDILSYATTLNGDSLITSPAPELYLDQSGQVWVETTVVAGDDSQQCAGSGGTLVTVWPEPVSAFTWSPERLYESNPELLLIQQALGFDSLTWLVDGEVIGHRDSLVARLYNAQPGPHMVCLYVENQYGCFDQHCHPVELIDLISVHVPNAFTPDADGINEIFGPVIDNPELLDYFDFVILDRWGQPVFRTADPYAKWQGGLMGSDHFVQNDVYLYILRYSERDSTDTIEKQGTVTIVR